MSERMNASWDDGALHPPAGRVPSAQARLFWVMILFLDLALVLLLDRTPYLLLGLLAIALLAWFFRHPRFGLALSGVGYILFEPLYRLTHWQWPGFLLGRFLVFAPLLAVLWNRAWAWPERQRLPGDRSGMEEPALWWSLALGLIMIVTCAWTPAPNYALFKTGSFFAQNLVFLAGGAVLLRGVNRPAQIETGFRFLRAVVAVEVLIGAASVWNYFTGYYPFTTRLITLGANAVILGRLIAVGLIALLALAAAGRMRWALILPSGALLLWVLYQAGSRGPILGLALATAFFVGTQPGSVGRWSRPMIAAALLGGGLFLIFYLPKIEAQAVAPLAGRESSNAVRVFLLQVAGRAVLEAWPWGLGTGGFPTLLKMGDLRFFPHNIFAEVLLENGVLGLVAFLGFLASLLRRWLQARAQAARLPVCREEAILLRTAGAFLVYSLFMAQVAGDLIGNDMVWWSGGVLLAWSRWNPGDPAPAGPPPSGVSAPAGR